MATSQEKVEVIVSVKDVATGVLKGIRGSFTELNSAVMLARQAWGVVSGVIGAATAEAAESEQVYTRLAAAVQRHGKDWAKTGVSIREFTASLQKTNAVSDELAAVGMQKLIDAGVGVDQSMQAVRAAFDFAAGTGMDVETVFGMLQKSARGSSVMFQRWGYDVNQAASGAEQLKQVLAAINKDFAGRAAADMDLYAGKVRNVVTQWKEIVELSGKVITANEGVKSGLGILGEALANVVRWQESSITLWESAIALWANTTGQLGLYVNVMAEVQKRDKAAAKAKAELEAVTAKASKVIDESNVVSERQLELIKKANEEMKAFRDIVAEEALTVYRAAEAQEALNRALEDYSDIQKVLDDQAQTQLPTGKGRTNPDVPYKTDKERQRMEDLRDLWKQTVDDMKAATASFVSNVADGFAEMVMGGKVDFGQMAKDFIKMFIAAAMKALLNFVALTVFHLKIFDKFENDMAIYKSGQDYAKFFTMGASDGFKGNRGMYAPNPYQLTNSLGLAGGGGSQTININLNVSGSSTFGIERQIIPVIEKAVSLNRSRIVRNSGMRLGHLASEVM